MRSYRQFRVVVKDSPRRVSGRTRHYMTERGMRGAVARAAGRNQYAEVWGLFEDPAVVGGLNWERVILQGRAQE